MLLIAAAIGANGCASAELPQPPEVNVLPGQVISRRAVPELRLPGARGARVAWAVFSPDGARVGWIAGRPEVEIWPALDPDETIRLGDLPGLGFPFGLCWSPDGRQVYLFGEGMPTSAYSLERQERLWSAVDGRHVSCSPNGERLALIGGDATLTILQAADGAVLAERPAPEAVPIGTASCWSPDGERILFVDQSVGRHEVLRADTLAVEQTITTRPGVDMAAWAPDGGMIAVAGMDFSEIWPAVVATYNSRSGELIADIGKPGAYPRVGDVVLWSPSGRYVTFNHRPAEPGVDTLQIHEAATGRLIARLDGAASLIRAAHWDQERQSVRAVYDNGEVWEWDVSTIE